MSESIEKRLSQVLPELSAEDVHAVASFAKFLADRRKNWIRHGNRQLTDEEHAQILAALNAVAALSSEQGPPVSNRDHDRYLYGAN